MSLPLCVYYLESHYAGQKRLFIHEHKSEKDIVPFASSYDSMQKVQGLFRSRVHIML